ncbi:MAG: YidC/Oxa1 family insertase periplasmic-domain containing protein [Elusimicrobiota bacterium]|jgi:YidC/Oxa1 family membrane protein insertase
MDRNLFLAVALSILVYAGWFGVMKRFYPEAAGSRPAAADASSADKAPTALAQASAGAPARQTPAQPPQAPAASSPAIADGRDGALSAKVGRIEMKLQPYGAAIASYLYPGPLGPVELVPAARPGFFATWPELSFRAVRLEGSDLPAFEAVHPSGVRIHKEFLIDEQRNLHRMRLVLTNPGPRPVELPAWDVSVGPGLGTVASELKENSSQWSSAVLLPPEAGKTQPRFETFKTKAEPQWRDLPLRWGGVHNRYFLAVVVTAQEAASSGKVFTGAQPIGSDRTPAPEARVGMQAVRLAPGASAVIDIPFYFGPKGYMALRELGLGFEKSVQFGWFDTFGRYALKVIDRLYRLTGNYGWAILLMTVLLQTLLFPLTYKQMKSAAVMKKLQPELARIQQKFAKDPQRLNQEMMELYRRHGANPLGGCLPLLLQMPVFVALFNALRNSWELHGAPWIFWVKDLSAHDPFYILPLIMGAIMFFQSKMNPVQTGDPMQSKMFQYMPVVFTFMFLKFPAGLVLYWLTNSALGLIQQMSLRKHWS